MKVNLKESGINVEIIYDKDGYFEHVVNLNTGEYMMVEIFLKGKGYDITNETGIMGDMETCDARYVRIMDIDVFIPRFLFIKNTHTMKAVLNFIINQELDLDEYPSLVKPLAKKFNIDESLANDIVNEVVKWENNTSIPDSLESVLNKKFNLPFY